MTYLLPAFGVATALVVRSAMAAPHPVDLVYVAPPECPDQTYVLERVAAQVQHIPAATLAASASIVRRGERFELDLTVEGGTQRIQATSCGELVDTLTVILSLAVDPRAGGANLGVQAPPNSRDAAAVLPGAPPETAPASVAPEGQTQTITNAPVGAAAAAKAPLPKGPSSPAAQANAPRGQLPSTQRQLPSDRQRKRAVTTPHRQKSQSKIARATSGTSTEDQPNQSMDGSATQVAADEASTKLEWHPTLLLWTEFGMLPRLAQGPNLGLWIDRGDYSLAITAEWLTPQFAQMSGGSTPRGGYVSFLGGQVGLCRRFLRPRLLSACLGVEAGDMMGKGTGLLTTRLGHGIWLSGNAEFAMRVPIRDWLGADLRLGFAVPIKRPAFGIDGFGWRFEPRAWSIRLATGFSWF